MLNLILCRLLDEQGIIIEEDNKEGEMCLKGPAMMLGYLDNPEATAEMIGEDGWLRSGDIGYRDRGKYYVIDRKKVCNVTHRPTLLIVLGMLIGDSGPHQSSRMASRTSRDRGGTTYTSPNHRRCSPWSSR